MLTLKRVLSTRWGLVLLISLTVFATCSLYYWPVMEARDAKPV